jgi:hypothetical protein
MFKGEMMKKLYLRILMALVGFAGLGVSAKAQAVDQIVATIPFEFVADGKTLPAGTYTVNRLSDDRIGALVLRSSDNRATAIVLPTEIESSPSEKGQVSFEKAGDEHFLSQIKTADYVYNIQVPRAATLLASTPSHSRAVSGSAGSN